MRKSLKWLLFAALLIALTAFALNRHAKRAKTGADAAPPAVAAVPKPAPLTHDASIVVIGGHGAKGGGAVAADGTIWLWGPNGFDGVQVSMEQRHLARQVKGIDEVTAISVEEHYMLALKADGTVWAQGSNVWGVLGRELRDGRQASREWVQVEGLSNVRDILANGTTAVAVKRDGTVWAWGSNAWQNESRGRLGKDFIGLQSFQPVPLPGLSGIVQVTGGGNGEAYFALGNDGVVWRWGRAYILGSPYPHTPEYMEPSRVQDLSAVRALAVDRSVTGEWLALRADDSLVLWGAGVNSCDNATKLPLELPEFHGAVSIAKAVTEVLAVKADGSLWRWGLVDTPDGARCLPKPERLLPPGSARSVAASGTARYVMLVDGAVWTWGNTWVLNRASQRTEIAWHDREQIAGLPLLKR